MRSDLDALLAELGVVPSPGQLRDYLVELFGSERIAERSQIQRPEEVTDLHALPDVASFGTSPRTDPVVGPSSSVRSAPELQRLLRRGALVAGAVGIGLFGAVELSSRAPSAVELRPVAAVPSSLHEFGAAPSPRPPVPVAPSAPAPSAPPRAVGSRLGILQLSCVPGCRVFIDGQDTGQDSPTDDMFLTEGRHHVRVVSHSTGKSKRIEVRIRPGHPVVRNVEL